MKAQVLLVDDDASVRTSLARVLETANLRVIQAANGVEALNEISRQRVDLVLLDLPEKNGWDTLRTLASFHPVLPVVVMTARSLQLVQAAAIGVGAVMEKPLDFPKLLRTVDELLSNSSAARLARSAEWNSAL